MSTEIKKDKAFRLFDDYVDNELDEQYECQAFRASYVLKKCDPEAYLELFHVWARDNDYYIVD